MLKSHGLWFLRSSILCIIKNNEISRLSLQKIWDERGEMNCNIADFKVKINEYEHGL